MYTNTLTLNNNIKIPQLGLGTWFIDDANVAEAVKAAATLGYRHFDTAQAYGNERGVGEGIQNCGISREELFVVSKVAAEHKTYEDAKQGIDETLKKMGLDYLDMMIIHSPQPWDKVNQCDDRYVEGNRAAWKALEDAYKEGKLRAIGVSNFQISDLKNLMETCEIKPMVNQILCHISNTPLELIKFCQENDIVIEAYSQLHTEKFFISQKSKQLLTNTVFLFHSFASAMFYSLVLLLFQRQQIHPIWKTIQRLTLKSRQKIWKF